MRFAKNLIKAGIVSILMLFLFAYFVLALSEVYVNLPTTGQNVSGNITLTATTNASAVNVTYRWENSTGQFVLNFTIYNDTYPDTDFTNTTFDTTALPDGVYNLTVNATNKTDTTVGNATVTDITVDNTPPNVITIHTPVSGANLSTGTQIFNATVNDTTLSVDTVRFNITNGTGSIILNASNPDSDFWNASIDLSTLAEEVHNATVLANDTVGNLNNTEFVTFTVDRTPPNVTLVNSSFNTTNTTSSITFNYTDALFATASCTLYFNNTGYNTSIVNNATNTLLTVSTLLSDGGYFVHVNCTDGSGNEGNSSSITVTIDTTPPAVTAFNTPASGSYHNASFVLNVTATDALLPFTVQYRFENGTDSNHIVVNWTNMSNPGGNFWNATINVTAIADWNYTIRINATDTLGNSNTTETRVIGIDDTSPVITAFSCDNIIKDQSQSCTCTATDNSQSFGGGVSTSISSADTSVVTTHTVTCTATDTASNTNTSTTSYTVSVAPTSNWGTSGGGGPKGAAGGLYQGIAGQMQKKQWAYISKNENASIEVENDAIGITNVQFSVAKKTIRPWIKIQRFDTLSGDLKRFNRKKYRIIEITENNIQSVLKETVIIKFKVKQSWLTENRLTKDRIALFRYNNNRWNELKTSIVDKDETYIRYQAETPGFSFFLIGEKKRAAKIIEEPESLIKEEVSSALEVTEEEMEQTSQTQEIITRTKTINPVLIVFLLIIVVIAVIAIIISLRKTKRKNKFSKIGSFIGKLRK
ncbi:MAG: PGF-pre-PGF domain-containing protein [Nanoarchaeota archaeon]|nr:PGF-pre-PGF domain-containing protein [Nanoarchaeota archaeon]